MKSLFKLLLEAKELKEKNVISFKDFRKYFFAEEPINVNAYWDIETDLYIIDDLKELPTDKWYVKYDNHNTNLHLEYLGVKGKTKILKNKNKITQYTNGIYIEKEKSWIVIGDKNIVKVI